MNERSHAGKAFANRADAGRQLAPMIADALARLGSRNDPLIVGIPRGGVVVAAAVAAALGLPLAALVVRKLGAPGHEEFALGAIADGVRIIDDASMRAAGVDAAALRTVEAAEREELARRRARFEPETAAAWDLEHRTVVIVDDGIATGASARAACEAARSRGAREVMLAVPVAPASWRPPGGLVDGYLCLRPVADFWAVGQFYENFTQTSDAEVERLLAPPTPAPEPASAPRES